MQILHPYNLYPPRPRTILAHQKRGPYQVSSYFSIYENFVVLEIDLMRDSIIHKQYIVYI